MRRIVDRFLTSRLGNWLASLGVAARERQIRLAGVFPDPPAHQ